jgi:hypothetical protein
MMFTAITRSRLAVAASILSLATIVAIVGMGRPRHDDLAPQAEDALVGQTARATDASGETIDTHFLSDSQLRWKVVAGPRKGEAGEDAMQLSRIGPSQFFVNRVEAATGDTVSEVYDTRLKQMWTYRTRLNPEDVLHRHEQLEFARLEMIPGDIPADDDAGEPTTNKAGAVTP